MQRQLVIEDTLQERVHDAIEEIKSYLHEYLTEHLSDYSEEDNDLVELPDFYNDLDYEGRIHEIIDSSVPIYTKEIEDTWYLHKAKLETAYDDAGLGSNPLENDGMVAIYCYIEQECFEWYQNNKQKELDKSRGLSLFNR